MVVIGHNLSAINHVEEVVVIEIIFMKQNTSMKMFWVIFNMASQ